MAAGGRRRRRSNRMHGGGKIAGDGGVDLKPCGGIQGISKTVGGGVKSSDAGFASSRAHVPSQQQDWGASLLAPPAYALYHHGASYGGAAAAWQQCGSKGTGVFIPRSTPGSAHPKKKGKNRGAAAAAKTARAAQQAAGAGVPTKKRV